MPRIEMVADNSNLDEIVQVIGTYCLLKAEETRCARTSSLPTKILDLSRWCWDWLAGGVEP